MGIKVNEDNPLGYFDRNIVQIGETKSALTNAFKGLYTTDTAYKPKSIKNSLDRVFFTRPQLNMSAETLKIDRRLSHLEINNTPINEYIKYTLDPYRCFKDLHNGKFNPKKSLIQYDNPFITIMSNTVDTITGLVPDYFMESYISEEGMRREQWGYADGQFEQNGARDVDMVFENIEGEPVLRLITTWLKYQYLLRIGVINSYPGLFVKRMIDYQSKVYYFKLGSDGKTINGISTSIIYPTSLGIGEHFEYKRYDGTGDKTKTVKARFKAFASETNDLISLVEFNELVMAFNPEIGNSIKGQGKYVEVPTELLSLVTNHAYPFVDLQHNHLTWLIDKDMLKQIKKDKK